MRFNSSDHIYRCKPPVLGNEKSDDPFYIGIAGIMAKDLDAALMEQQMLTPDNRAKKSIELIKKQVKYIENLFIGEREIKTFDELYEYAPREIYQWVCGAAYSTLALSDAEVKN